MRSKILIVADILLPSYKRIATLLSKEFSRLGVENEVLNIREHDSISGDKVIVIGDLYYILKYSKPSVKFRDARECYFWVDTIIEFDREALEEARRARFCKVIAPSRATESFYNSIGLNVIARIPYQVDFALLERARRDRKFKSMFGKYILFIGRDPSYLYGYLSRKGIDRFVQAVEILWEFLMSRGLRVVALSTIKERKGIDVIWSGSLSDVETYSLICNASLFVFPSRREGFGMPPLEAMACGVPLVYTDAPAHNEFSIGFKVPTKRAVIARDKDGNRILMYDYDVEDLVDAIREAIINIESRSEVINKLISEAYNKSKWADSLRVAKLMMEAIGVDRSTS